MSEENFSIELIGYLEGHKDAVTSLVCGENQDGSPLLISGSRDKHIIQWSLNLDDLAKEKKEDKTLEKVGKPLRSLHGHNHFVSSLALSSDNTKLVSGSWDKTIRLWDLTSSKCLKTFTGHTKDVLSVAFSHDERLIFSGAMDNTLKYWNTQGDLKFDNNRFGGWVSSIINIKKAKQNYIAVGSWDSTVKILNSEYNVDREIQGNEYAVTSMSIDDEGDYLFIAFKNGVVQIWNINDNSSDNSTDNMKQSIETNVDINSILYDSKYFEVFALGTSKGLEIRKIKGDKALYYQDKGSACLSLTYDKTKSYLFAGFADGKIQVYRTSSVSE